MLPNKLRKLLRQIGETEGRDDAVDTIAEMLGNPDRADANIWDNLGDFRARTGGLASLSAVIGLPDTGTSLYEALYTNQLANAGFGLNALKTLIDNIQNTVNDIGANIHAEVRCPAILEKPKSSTVTVRVWFYMRDSDGGMQDPDTGEVPEITITESNGTAVSPAISAAAMTKSDTGLYYYDWVIQSTYSIIPHHLQVSVVRNAQTELYGKMVDIVDNASDINSILTAVGNIYADTQQIISDVSVVDGNVDQLLLDVAENQTDLDAILAELADGTYGLSALNTDLDAILADIGDFSARTNNPSLLDVLGVPDNPGYTIWAKLDSMSASGDAKMTFDEYIAPIVAVGGEVVSDAEAVDIGTYTTQSTSFAELFSHEIDVPHGSGTKTVQGAEIDLSWKAYMDASTGTTKWMVSSDGVFGNAVDLTDDVAVGTPIKIYNKSGIIRLTQMAAFPFTLHLAGKVDNAANTLTAKIRSDSIVRVTAEIEI